MVVSLAPYRRCLEPKFQLKFLKSAHKSQSTTRYFPVVRDQICESSEARWTATSFAAQICLSTQVCNCETLPIVAVVS